jgi:hypothetical protein
VHADGGEEPEGAEERVGEGEGGGGADDLGMWGCGGGRVVRGVGDNNIV